jgi:hypothetical protein
MSTHSTRQLTSWEMGTQQVTVDFKGGTAEGRQLKRR